MSKLKRLSSPVRARSPLPYLTLIVCCSCQIGPQWKNQVTVPPIAAPASTRIVVSNFMKSVTDISATSSSQVRTIREQVRRSDVSSSVAAALRAEGINAEARSEWKREQLKPGELLLQGAFVGQPWDSGSRDFGNAMILIVSLGMISTLLPTPVALHTGQSIEVRYELIDSRGKIYLQESRETVIGYYSDHWFYGRNRTRKGVAMRLIDELPAQFARALAPQLRRAQTE